MSQQEAEEPSSSSSSLDEAFCDTCVLLNFAQREWEGDRTTTLLKETHVRFVIGEAVEEEFETVTSRRTDAYKDLLAFLPDGETALEDFDPDVWGNDERHLYELIGRLEDLNQEEAATRFRQYLRKFRARTDYIMKEIVDEIVFTVPPLFFANTLHEVVPNSDDCKVLAEAADWTHTGGSGILVTMDGEDMLEKLPAINEKIDDEYDDDTKLVILTPEGALQRAKCA